MCKDRQSLYQSLSSTLKFISIGQINLSLYHNQSLKFSSIIGGLCSVLFVIWLIVYTIIIMVSIFNLETYNLQYNVLSAQDADFSSIYDYILQDFKFVEAIFVVVYSSNSSDCNDIYFNVSYKTDSLSEEIGSFQSKFSDSASYENRTECFFNVKSNKNFTKAMSDGKFNEKKAVYSFAGTNSYSLMFTIHDPKELVKFILVSYDKSFISNNGKYQQLEFIVLDSAKEQFLLNIDLLEYKKTDNIVGIFQSYSEELLVNNYLLQEYDYNGTASYIQFDFGSAIFQFKQAPTSIIDGLTKVGGLFGVIKIIAIFVQFMHYKLFERSLKKQINQQEAPSLTAVAAVDINRSEIDPFQQSLIYQQEENADAAGSNQSIQEVFSYDTIQKFFLKTKELEKMLQQIQQRSQEKDQELQKVKDENDQLRTTVINLENNLQGLIGQMIEETLARIGRCGEDEEKIKQE